MVMAMSSWQGMPVVFVSEVITMIPKRATRTATVHVIKDLDLSKCLHLKASQLSLRNGVSHIAGALVAHKDSCFQTYHFKAIQEQKAQLSQCRR